jgi:hypothetical protein
MLLVKINGSLQIGENIHPSRVKHFSIYAFKELKSTKWITGYSG